MSTADRTRRERTPNIVPGLATIVGFLVCVEIASGVLQGFYTPIFSDIADHLSIQDADVNWFEAAQLVVSALVVPVLARLGDLIGHRQVLLISTAVTALASWALAFAPTFTTFLVAWAIQGFYVVWLPLEVEHHPPPYGEHRRPGPADPSVRRVPRGRARARRDRRRGHQRRPRRGDLDDVPADAAGDRGDGLLRGRLVRRRGHSPAATGRLDLKGFGLVTRVHRPGDGRPDPGARGRPRFAVPLARARPRAAQPVAVRARRARHRGAADRRTPAGDPGAVAGAADRVPVRDVGARRADPAVDVRADRSRRGGLRPRRLGRVRVDADRGLRDLAGRSGRCMLPLAARFVGTRGAMLHRVPAGRPRLRPVPAAARLHRADPGQHGDRRHRVGRPGGRPPAPPRPRPPRPTGPASSPG